MARHLIFTGLLAALAATVQCAEPAEPTYLARVDALYREHADTNGKFTIEHLVKLDAELRAITQEIRARANDEHKLPYDAGAVKEETLAPLGLFIGHQSGLLEYSGSLLVQAHEMNPHSSWRAHTLFSLIFGSRLPREYDGMPNMQVAFQYVDEFPEGPFASQAWEVLATVYDDFYKSLGKFMTDKIHADDVYLSCFKPWLNGLSYGEQRLQVEVLARSFYDNALRLAIPESRQAADVTSKRDNFNSMTTSEDSSSFEVWYWCSDC